MVMLVEQIQKMFDRAINFIHREQFIVSTLKLLVSLHATKIEI
jgi:hypothetical protein